MTPQRLDRIGRLIAGMICGGFLFLFSMFAIMRGDSDGRGVLGYMLAYIIVGGLLGLLVGDRFFRFIERHWFRKD